jgi:thioredoxin reductase
VLVVGGGIAAAESALALADHGACASVTLSYRRAELRRLGRRLRASLADAIAGGRVRALMPSEVTHVRPDRVVLRSTEEMSALWNDTVIVQAGGTVPRELLADRASTS